MTLSLLNNEVYGFWLYDYFHRICRCVNVGERMTIDAYRCVLGDCNRDVVTPVWKYHFVVQNPSAQEKCYAREYLGKGRVTHHGNVNHSIVWHGVRGLSEAQCTTYTHRHNAMLLSFVIDSIFHLPEHTLEEQEDERNDV